MTASENNSISASLERRLRDLREKGLCRETWTIDAPQGAHIRIAGRELINFSSNDYLGLANDPAVKEAAIEAITRYGAGSGASRLISGSLAPHTQLEDALAAFKGTNRALSFSSGYAAAIGTVCALVGSDDIIILDKLSHACLVDAARLSRAKLRVFAHNDLEDLEKLLKWAGEQRTTGKSEILILTETVFSMDGDVAPLKEIVELKERYGAWLMVDEAHATGLYGPHRRGIADEMGIGDRIEIHMGTFSKALGASGGYVCGSGTLIEYLVNRARSFIFSTAPVPAAAAAATKAIQLIQSEEGARRCKELWNRVADFHRLIGPAKDAESQNRSAIIPWIIGAESQSVEAAKTLRADGLFVPAIRYPTVARGKSRLRISLSAAHSREDVSKLTAALNLLGTTLGKSMLPPCSVFT